jgi:hypothetical protein
MTQENTETSPADVLIGALRLQRERVVADTTGAKQATRGALDAAITKMIVWKDTGQGGPDPEALKGLLGDPDEAGLRHALEAYAGAVGE